MSLSEYIVLFVFVAIMGAWMLGSVAGFQIGLRGGRRLLDHPGRLEKGRRKLLAKGDRAGSWRGRTGRARPPGFGPRDLAAIW